MLQEMLPFALI